MTEHILVTGATGYVGGRLVPKLLEAGYPVRCFVRDPERLSGYPWLEQVEVVSGDALDRASLLERHAGRDRRLLPDPRQAGRAGRRRARPAGGAQLCRGAGQAGVGRIIYLGELVDPSSQPLPLPARPPRDRAYPAPAGRAGDRVPRRDDRRRGQRPVRDDPLPGRAPAAAHLPALVLHPGAAHRHPRRAGLPGRRAAGPGERGQADRDRRRTA